MECHCGTCCGVRAAQPACALDRRLTIAIAGRGRRRSKATSSRSCRGQAGPGSGSEDEAIASARPAATHRGVARVRVRRGPSKRPAVANSGRPFRPEWEAEMLNLDRVVAYLAHAEWFRQTNGHGECWLGPARTGDPLRPRAARIGGAASRK